MNREELTAKEAQVRLEELCVKAERCEHELRDKLRKWGITATDTDEIMQKLISAKFVDDRRFTAAYVNDKIKFARWGKRKVYQALMQKRISSDIIRETLNTVDGDLYAANLHDFLASKIKAHPELKESFEGRTKLFRYAISRGYEPSLASTALRAILLG